MRQLVANHVKRIWYNRRVPRASRPGPRHTNLRKRVTTVIEFHRLQDRMISSGQYQLVQTEAWWMGRVGTSESPFIYLAENILSVWIPADRDAVWELRRELTGRRRWLVGSEDDASNAGFSIRDPWPTGTWQAQSGRFFPNAGSNTQSSWQRTTPEFIEALPRGARGLYLNLHSASPPDRLGYRGVFTYASDGLRSGLLPVDLRAPLFKAMLMSADVGYSDQSISPDGRSSFSIYVDDGVHCSELFLDPSTGELIGERNKLVVDLMALVSGTETKRASVRHSVVDGIGLGV